MFSYRLFGCNLDSEIALPALPEAVGGTDVTIRLGSVPGRLTGAIGEGVCYSAAAGEALIVLPRIARFHVRRGEEIVVDPAPGVAQEDLRLFLLNLVFGVLLQQRSSLVLHAAVIESDDGCIALAGVSGAGKSTLAAGLLARGRRVLSDEICVIKRGTGRPPSVVPGPPYIQIWADALHRFGHDPARLVPVREGIEKYFLPLGPLHAGQDRTLRAVYVLSPWNATEIAVEALSGADRLEALIEHTYRAEYLQPMGLAAANFERLLGLAAEVPTLRLRSPGSSRSIERILDLLEAQAGPATPPQTEAQSG